MNTSTPPIDLRNPYVRAIAFGRMAGVLGLQIIIVAVGWQLYELTNSAWSLGIVGIIELVPVLLLMVPAGNLADRMARRNMAIYAQIVMFAAAVGLMAIAARQNHGLGHLRAAHALRIKVLFMRELEARLFGRLVGQ